MPDVVVQNPVIKSAFGDPQRHFEFGDRGITGKIDEGRLQAGDFVPIPHGRWQTAQLSLEAVHLAGVAAGHHCLAGTSGGDRTGRVGR